MCEISTVIFTFHRTKIQTIDGGDLNRIGNASKRVCVSIGRIYARQSSFARDELLSRRLALKNSKVPPSILFASVFYLIFTALLLVSMIVANAPLKQSRSVMWIPFITPDEDAIFDEQHESTHAREAHLSIAGSEITSEKMRTALNEVECARSHSVRPVDLF